MDHVYRSHLQNTLETTIYLSFLAWNHYSRDFAKASLMLFSMALVIAETLMALILFSSNKCSCDLSEKTF